MIDTTKFENMGYRPISTEDQECNGYFVFFRGDRISNSKVIIDSEKQLITIKSFFDPYGDSSCYKETHEMTFQMFEALAGFVLRLQ